MSASQPPTRRGPAPSWPGPSMKGTSFPTGLPTTRAGTCSLSFSTAGLWLSSAPPSRHPFTSPFGSAPSRLRERYGGSPAAASPTATTPSTRPPAAPTIRSGARAVSTSPPPTVTSTSWSSANGRANGRYPLRGTDQPAKRGPRTLDSTAHVDTDESPDIPIAEVTTELRGPRPDAPEPGNGRPRNDLDQNPAR